MIYSEKAAAFPRFDLAKRKNYDSFSLQYSSALQEEEDTEWKFARTKMYMEYIKDGSTLCVPLNLVPTWKAAYHGMRDFCRKCGLCCTVPEPAPPKRVPSSIVGTLPNNFAASPGQTVRSLTSCTCTWSVCTL